MATITRQGIPTYQCIDGVVCGDIIDPLFVNKMVATQKAIAETGVDAANFSNGYTHGRTRPFNGWMPGSNIHRTTYTTNHMVELSKDMTHYVLQFTAKLGDLGGGRAMQWATVYLRDPSGTPLQRLGEIKRNNYTSTPPLEFPAQTEQIVRVRIVQPIETYMLATLGPGEIGSFDLITQITIYGAAGTFNITDNDYWAGIRDLNLKFFRQCP